MSPRHDPTTSAPAPVTAASPAAATGHPDLADALWAGTRCLADLARLAGAWAAGDVPELPGFGAATEGLRDVADELREVTDAGVVVLDAQRGADEGWRELRAFAVLLCDARDAAALAADCAAAGLHVRGGTVPDAAGRPGVAGVPPWLRAVPVTRWEDGTYARGVAPRPEAVGSLADAVGPEAATHLRVGAALLLVVDPQWARDDRLWPALRSAAGSPSSHPGDVGGDAFDVERRITWARRAMTVAFDAWFAQLLREVATQVHDLLPASRRGWLVILQAHEDDDASDLAAARLAWWSGRDTARTVDLTAPAMGVLWVELGRALGALTGTTGARSLVVAPEDGVVLAWWPRWCVVHEDGPTLAGWFDAEHAGPPPGLARADDPRNLGDPPLGVCGVLHAMERRGVAVPVEAVVC